MTGSAGLTIVILAIGLPVAAFTLWPLLRRGAASSALWAVPPDASEQLAEQKRQVLRVLRELQFEHEAGHVSDDDYADLRTRYEADAAQIFTELDRLERARPRPEPPRVAPTAPARSAWRHPLALATGAVALVVFGIALGAGITRYAAPDSAADMSAPGAGVLASPEPPGGGARSSGQRTLSPDVLRGMLQAARTSLFQGRLNEAIAAYQAVLKRDPNNVDALTHLGLIVAKDGGHADLGLKMFDKALAIEPNYPPALLYRGQILYETNDTAGAIRSWEQFLKVVPPGEEHTRVKELIAEARSRK